MIGIGAIVQFITRAAEAAASAAAQGVRFALGDRAPQPCLVPIPAEIKRRRR